MERRVPGGETIDKVRVYIEQRRSYDARRRENSVENSTGNSGKAEFSGVKRSIFIFFSLFAPPKNGSKLHVPFSPFHVNIIPSNFACLRNIPPYTYVQNYFQI